jgi:hypothetical protein
LRFAHLDETPLEMVYCKSTAHQSEEEGIRSPAGKGRLCECCDRRFNFQPPHHSKNTGVTNPAMMSHNNVRTHLGFHGGFHNTMAAA